MKIDWAYLRKGWKSCINSQEVLETHQVSINEVVDARKERFDAEKVWDLLHKAKSITTAKGKNVQTWDPEVDDKTTILKHVMGPSGNLRAPAYRTEDDFVIGFNSEFYDKWLTEK